mmetsp:Transcript_133871/g.427872  ORF Transcript_133871/g.427872 Transcript_133871/m.427872 type:complete len:256 (+) Transcript_133871:701-1468(+)
MCLHRLRLQRGREGRLRCLGLLEDKVQVRHALPTRFQAHRPQPGCVLPMRQDRLRLLRRRHIRVRYLGLSEKHVREPSLLRLHAERRRSDLGPGLPVSKVRRGRVLRHRLRRRESAAARQECLRCRLLGYFSRLGRPHGHVRAVGHAYGRQFAPVCAPVRPPQRLPGAHLWGGALGRRPGHRRQRSERLRAVSGGLRGPGRVAVWPHRSARRKQAGHRECRMDAAALVRKGSPSWILLACADSRLLFPTRRHRRE